MKERAGAITPPPEALALACILLLGILPSITARAVIWTIFCYYLARHNLSNHTYHTSVNWRNIRALQRPNSVCFVYTPHVTTIDKPISLLIGATQ
jgi:hypothetical protein